jgi:hypothetical protein
MRGEEFLWSCSNFIRHEKDRSEAEQRTVEFGRRNPTAEIVSGEFIVRIDTYGAVFWEKHLLQVGAWTLKNV